MIIPLIILKNLKIIFRSPFTILLLILSPILLMFVVGLTYSGNTLTDTQVGLIETQNSVFNLYGVKFKEYNSGDFINSRNQCVLDLKKGEVELCISFSSTFDSNNNLLNAKIVYFIDDTRPQISDILVRNFNQVLDLKTKEISTKTVEDIFDEVKETISFMNESKKLTSKINDDLDLAEKNLLEAKSQLNIVNEEYTDNYPLILENINDLRVSINENSQSLNELRNNFVGLEKDLNSLNSDLPDYINEVSSVIQGIEIYSQLNPDINNYVNINELSTIKSELVSLNNEIKESKSIISKAISDLNKIPDTSQIIEDLNDFENYLNDIKIYLNVATVQINEILNNIHERQAEILKIDSELDDKLEYFNQLSNQKASTITEPITKEYFNTFEHFSRVHQLAPIVVILVLLFIGLLLSNVIVSLEINSKAYFRNLISPISQWKFILSLFFTSFIIISIQLLFLFIILHTFFGIKLFDPSLALSLNIQHMSQIFVVILHLLLVFILLGILLAYLFSSIQISILVTTFVMLFLFLLSDIIIPLNIMPVFFSTILKYSPVVLGENLIRLLFFYSKYYSLRFIDLLVFYPLIFILLGLVSLASRRRKKILF